MTTAPLPVYKSRFLKADRRTVIQAEGGQTYRTSFEQPARLDDIFIRPGASVQMDATGLTGQLLVLPIVGGALLTTAQTVETALLPGYLYTVPAAEAGSLVLTNPFEKETVNILLIQAPVPSAAAAVVQEFQLPLTEKNVLVAPDNPALPVRVGLYDSRVKGHIPALGLGGFSLCYVLNGSFEIEDRLAEHRDALLLWETAEIEFEALSETAILLYLEFGASS
ncbi:hypothetical protein Q5H92_00700 [Hymenobacter sp. M29]|uniref:Quercetin 2,3-dioxygenase C-terminal cupin domain-containing protein n=1 Tax=Hymenobacter mellowenesis TaxID=3063995 RepID=A0ABT9A4T5_9BACT|nr:hypothetical protein [Hymenobacter sp. M29]MDO7844858.1 hypothetical protein [Hymenobacter sp. M29]